MCGIVGLTDQTSLHLLSEMNEMVSYRGPDDCGVYLDTDNAVGLAMRRLSIIDLEGGHQPMSNEDDTVWIVCNGEIYNSPELRSKLEAQGHQFKTINSDVEILVHLYEEKGKNMLDDLNGMFSFVIYDRRQSILFAVRDRMGIKPLYYALKHGKLAFSSELKSLMLLPWISREIDFTSLYHYLSLQFIPAPDTIFVDIKKLPAGHSFTYHLTNRQLDVEKYWELNVRHAEERPIKEWREVIREKLTEAVNRWTLSDVPIACSLSGGLDSSTIVGLLGESGVGDLSTFSLGFGAPEEQGCNELPLARKVAEKWGTKHHEVILEPEHILKDLERFVWHLDEPYGGGLPSWYIYEFVGRDCKVVLTGTGGDELFGNYQKFSVYEQKWYYRWLENIKCAVRERSFREIRDGLVFPRGHFYHRYLSDAAKDAIMHPSKDHVTFVRTEAYLERVWKQANTHDTRNAVAYVDFRMQLPEEFLLVTDRFSMAHSVEARVPFLDHTLVELVYRIPSRIRTRNGDPKYLLKDVIKDILPAELLLAPKRGFILPLDVWTRKDLKHRVEEMLSRDYLEKQGIFSSRVHDRLVIPHMSGKRDLTQQIWTLFMFQLWYQVFVSGDRVVG